MGKFEKPKADYSDYLLSLRKRGGSSQPQHKNPFAGSKNPFVKH